MRKQKGGKKRGNNIRDKVEVGFKPVRHQKGLSEFGQKIDFVLAQKNLNNSDLARISGISRQAVYNLKRSEYPKGTSIFKISKALDIPVSFFFEEGFSSLCST